MRETAGRTFQGKGTEAEGLEKWWEMRPGRWRGQRGLCPLLRTTGLSSSEQRGMGSD